MDIIRSKKTPTAHVLLAALAMAGTLATGHDAHAQSAFAAGNVTGSVSLGRGEALGKRYTTVGAGVGYMLADGLMAGINGELWLGEDPSIQKLTPEVRYIFTRVNPVKPYVGGFFTRTFYEDLDDRNSWGARGGIYIPFGNAAMNVGLVYERVLDCNTSTYRDCSQFYPEVGLMVSF